jgi:four helix bundle protein
MLLPWENENGYRKLRVWRLGIELVKHCYRATAAFPPEERYGLTSQIRRAAVSITTNLAEGYARRNTTELIYFSSISGGSASELENLIVVSYEVGLLPVSEAVALFNEAEDIGKMLGGMRRKLERRPKKP